MQRQNGIPKYSKILSPARKLSTYLCDIYHCQVYSELTPDDGQRNYPKHVEVHFLTKINLGN
jgi:hypothetical protein